MQNWKVTKTQKEKASRYKLPAVDKVKYHMGFSEYFAYHVTNFLTILINI